MGEMFQVLFVFFCLVQLILLLSFGLTRNLSGLWMASFLLFHGDGEV